MRMIKTSLFVATVLALGACKREEPAETTPLPAHDAATPAEPTTPPPVSPVADDQSQGGTASAKIEPTQGSNVKGEVTFAMVDGKLHVTGQLSGLAPNSTHGFHIHEKGDCSAPDGSSAGGHFNPAQAEHGSVDSSPHHAGDMPNIVADADGNATIDGPLSSDVDIGKGDQYDIAGHAVIVHADPDDYKTQPTGNAGARLACGVITTNNAPAPMAK